MKSFLLVVTLFLCLASSSAGAQADKPPVRIAIVGLTHDHALGFIPRACVQKEVQLVGIVESDPELVARYARRFQLNTNLFFASLDELRVRTQVQAVAVFTSTFDHRRVVQECVRLGIRNVMMQKPLAVNMIVVEILDAAHESARTGRRIDFPVVDGGTTTHQGGAQVASSECFRG